MHGIQSAAVSTFRRRRDRRCSYLLDALEPRRLFAADLVISEFLASNSNGIVDSFGDKSDWIEIHNRGNASANLNDYFLTDTAVLPTQWRFPAQNLAAGDYLVVFASSRNIALAGQQLHTNFKLGADGEYLGLIRADGAAQSEYAPTYPAQTANISYGLTNENSATSGVQFFNAPTPGAVNITTAAAPTFNIAGKVFTGTLSVTLSTPTTAAGTTIHYTLDRTEPTLSSPTYTTAFTVSSTKMIRAKTFAPGLATSVTVSQSYVLADASITPIDTNLGTVVIDTFGTGLNDTTMALGTGTFIDNRGDGHSNVTDTADYLGRIGVRTRGSTSQNLPKKSLAIELWDEANKDRKASLLGMPADSDWILYAAYQEKSLMQDPLAFDWAREMGLLAPRVRYVEVYLSTDGGSSVNYATDYVGVYILMEKIKVGEDRVDIAEIGPLDNAEPAVTGGYLWKKDRIEADETLITTNSDLKYSMVDPETLTSQQSTYLTKYLNDFEAALNGANFKDPINGYAKYIDVDSWVNTWIMVEMTRQVDAYALSTFYYKDRGGKIVMGPVWDWNISMGNSFYLDAEYAVGYQTDTLSPENNWYVAKLLSDPAFKQKIVDRWTQLRHGAFSNAQLMADIDARVAELSDSNSNYPTGQFPTQTPNNPVVRNFKRWATQGVFVWPNGFYDQDGRWIEDVKMTKNWLVGRLSWLDSKLLAAPVYSVAGGYRTSPTSITLTPYRSTAIDVTLLGANVAVKAIIPTSDMTGWKNIGYNTAGWLSGTGGVGYDTTTTPYDFTPLIGVNVGAMQGNRTSVFARYEFNVSDPAAIESLVLKMKYEDGFVAYLNNHRIASYNDPGTGVPSASPFYTPINAVAGGPRFEGAAFSFQEFDVTALKSVLVAGTNVLAIHGLNAEINSNDLIMLPELVSRTRVVNAANADTQVWYTLNGSDPLLPDGITRSPAALLYTGAISVATTERVKSRSLRSGVWSGLGEQYYNFQTDALRVSEIMYNPAPPPAGSPYSAQDFEFVELRNASNVPLDLGGYAFDDGIEFTFPNVTIPANGVGVIVANLAAFQSRYGTSVTPIGIYSGSLDNGGETLLLDNPFGQPAQTFAYDDAWYPTTDGGGASLEVNGPATLDLNLSTSWRAGLVTNGTPGIATVLDTTSPTVSTTQYLYETSPNRITIQFSEDVGATLGLADVVVTNLTTGVMTDPVSITFDVATKTATLAFAAGPMIDGNYRATLAASGVTDAAGNALDGDGNGSAGGDLLFDFFVLGGDANRDRKVDFQDLVILSQNYDLTSKTFSQGNVDYSSDGKVDFQDLVILSQKYDLSLPALPSAISTKKPTKRAVSKDVL
jgi:hypothetical protein